MKKYLIIILLSTILSNCKKHIEERIEYSKLTKGKIESKCQYIKGTNIKNGFCIDYDINGNILGKFHYVNDKLEGEQIYYNDYGGIESIKFFKNDKLEGIVKRFYDNNLLKSKVLYKNNKLWNIISVYDENQNLLNYGNFKDGNGLVNVYHNNGKLEYSGRYKNGKAEGKWIYITDRGHQDTIVYKNGVNDWGLEVIFY